ncbi:glycosyltransferase family 4 protein [Jeotgalibaca arthritidis]|uniref:Glycosyltransferase family 4 protein n=1 Tax=Jeotgalibaca arthritidis TaxID=1868794 RepID=A0A6G7KAX3_9LACT|nr:glycosyltransferase family 4 protein [Jeotgalibaca arthritidis]QII82418.1 glycosyltransferase family 4 protein [Jeotgalibaca arthritidis]
MKKKYLFISNMAAPYQVKFCYSLQEYFDTEFWFYEYIDETRPDWWKIPLGDKCKIMKASGKFPKVGYFSFGLFIDMLRFKPDIVVLGGFMKWHILVLHFAKFLGAKVAVMSEPLRYVSNDDQGSADLFTKINSSRKIKLIKKLFEKVDLYIGMGEVAKNQFLEEFGFPEDKVTSLSYPQDIEEYYNHPLRVKKLGDPITLLFANRLVERYQPLMALEVLRRISLKYPNIKMLMNASGSQKEQCVEFIEKNNLTNIEFLDKIDSWNDMHLIYKRSDILILPCVYSNGNGTIIEARASGMGIVISNQINNIERHSKNGKNCFICNLDIDEFEKAVSKYINNLDLLVEHGKLSRELVKYRRNDYTAKKYFEVFQEHDLVD